MKMLVIGDSQEHIEELKLHGYDLELKQIDVGHGCNLGAWVVEVLGKVGIVGVAADVIALGCFLNDIKSAYEGFKGFKDMIDKWRGKYKTRIYYEEDILVNIALGYVIDEYYPASIDYIKLTAQTKVKLGSVGFYAVQNYGYSKESLEGSPETLNYFVFEVKSDDLESDTEIVTCQIYSNGEVLTLNKTPISTGVNIN